MIEKILLTDLGDADDAKIQEILVNKGDLVKKGDTLLVIETSKVAIEIDAPGSGEIKVVHVKVGDSVEINHQLIDIEMSEQQNISNEEKVNETNNEIEEDICAELLILGSGPGGYSAAFRAADLGKKVVMVERQENLGGVCLNVGCIPSKAYLHAAKVISENKELAQFGVQYSSIEINREKLRSWKNKIVGDLTNGLSNLAKKRNVDIIHGVGTFVSSNKLKVTFPSGRYIFIEFEHAIIAAGSEPTVIPTFPNDDDRLMTSTEALEINQIPKRLLIIGGGIIGLEMATVYHELGSKVTVVESADSLMPGADKDLVNVLHKKIVKQYECISLNSRVFSIESTITGLYVQYETPSGIKKDLFDQVLVSVGRRPNGNKIDAQNAGVNVNENGFITTNSQMRTNVNNIFAIGDIVGQPMLAHKAAHEGRVAAEVISGLDSKFDGSLIPSVAYTDPEIAWVGVSEEQAKISNIDYDTGIFPWAASGRSLCIGRKEGFTKTIYNKNTKEIIGAAIVGSNAGELISEAALAIYKKCKAHEIGHLIHPHPTLSETVGQSAEVFEKTIVDMYIK